MLSKSAEATIGVAGAPVAMTNISIYAPCAPRVSSIHDSVPASDHRLSHG